MHPPHRSFMRDEKKSSENAAQPMSDENTTHAPSKSVLVALLRAFSLSLADAHMLRTQLDWALGGLFASLMASPSFSFSLSLFCLRILSFFVSLSSVALVCSSDTFQPPSSSSSLSHTYIEFLMISRAICQR